MSNVNFDDLMKMLSQMDKKELEEKNGSGFENFKFKRSKCNS